MDIVAKCYKRMDEAFDDKKSIRCLSKLCRNAEFAIASLEGEGVITEAQKTVKSLKAMNKKISLSSHSRAIDNILVFVLLKSLLTVPSTTTAFKMGLIDKDGNLIREPKTAAENDAISNLDLLIAQLRHWIRPHIQKLSAFSWIRATEGNTRVQNMLSNAETVSKRFTIMRANEELGKILQQR